jgi:hypothetical protein
MAEESRVTTDPGEIRRWAEERGGRPARVKGTGILRIQFDESDDDLEPISWEEFFDEFERNGLALLYQERKANGELSTFQKFVSREAVQAGA